MSGTITIRQIPTHDLRNALIYSDMGRMVYDEHNDHRLDFVVTHTYSTEVDQMHYTCYTIDDSRNMVVGKAQNASLFEAMAEAVLLAQIPWRDHENGK